MTSAVWCAPAFHQEKHLCTSESNAWGRKKCSKDERQGRLPQRVGQ